MAALCIPFLVEIGRERCAVRCGMAMGKGGRGASECIPFLVLAIGSAVSDIACAPGPALRMAFKANSSTGGEQCVVFFMKATFMLLSC